MTACPTCGHELAGDGVVVDLETNTAIIDGEPLRLQPKEAELLYVLAQVFPHVAHRDRLFVRLWGDSEPKTAHNALSVHVANLRRSLAGTTYSVASIQGAGYQLVRVGEDRSR